MSRPTGNRPPRGEGGVQWFRALVLIAVLVAVGIVILAKTTSTPAAKTSSTRPAAGPSTTVTTAPTTTTTAPPLPASQVKVQVLNGLQSGNLASQWTTKLKTQYGYQTGPPDDTTSKVTASTIYVITPGYEAEADQLAAHVGLTSAAVNPTVPAPASAPIPAAERAAANLVLVIGSDLAG